MARTALPVNTITRTGITPASETAGDATNGMTMVNNGRTVLLTHNTNGGSTAHTLTISLTGAVDGQGIVPRTWSIAASASKYIGPFPADSYGGTMKIDVDNSELHLTAYSLG